MTLTTHAVVGAAAASLMPSHPVIGFCAGFASHFVLDAIPHWDYPIHSASIDPKIAAKMRYDRAFLLDVLSIGSDGLLGLALPILFFASPENYVAVLAGAIGGMLPDPLQFVSTHLRREPLMTLQRFHQWIHSPRRLRNEGRHALGIGSQVLLAVGCIALVLYANGSLA